ncbi:MAG TPA: acyl-CoA desaturase, partial [Chthoniobacterales bacterium]|nr:acyl-CoA desaturase [Chthoniobacterales bacterium]
YRNGVKPWHFDPTKWIIWRLSKIGLAEKLRRVPEEKIIRAELREAQLRLEASLAAGKLSKSRSAVVLAARQRLLEVEERLSAQRQQGIEVAGNIASVVRREIRTAARVLGRMNQQRPEIALRVGNLS